LENTSDAMAKAPINYSPTRLPCFYVLLCPAAPSSEKSQAEGLIHYVGVAGVGLDSPSLPIGDPKSGVFGYDRQIRIEDNGSTISSLPDH
jgi:hypothetical protein